VTRVAGQLPPARIGSVSSIASLNVNAGIAKGEQY
jgi:hypothetical protein